MNITHRCLTCGSDNIQVKVHMNLKDRSIVTDRDDTECYCHACQKHTDYGWVDLGEILKKRKTYSVEQVIAAGCTLEPIECKFCHSLEVTYNQYIKDALCGDCGKWQVEDDTQTTL